jgi:hypothetical protein
LSETCEAIGLIADRHLHPLALALREAIGGEAGPSDQSPMLCCSGRLVRERVVAAVAEADPTFRLTVAEARAAGPPPLQPFEDLGTDTLHAAAERYVDGLSEALGVDLRAGALGDLVADMLVALADHEGRRALFAP